MSASSVPEPSRALAAASTRPRGARLVDGLMLVVGLGLLVRAHGIAGFEALSSPGALPLAAAAVLVGAALTSLLERGRRVTGNASALSPRLVLLALLLVVFAWMLETLGFLVAGTGFLVLAFLVLDPTRPLRALLLAPLATLGLWVLFRLVFEVLLPEGIVPERAILAWIGDWLAGLRGAP